MAKDRGSYHQDGDKASLLSNVALLYYGEGLTQGEIAKRMKVSRATIVNMLRESRERGIVEIRVDGKHLKESTLARDLRDKFGLEDVYVSDTGESAARPDALAQLGRVAGMAFLDIVEPGDRIGVAWGETIMAMSDQLPRVFVRGSEVSQLIGSMISSRVPASENCAIQIANKIGATCFTLHAPGIVSTSELAKTFRAEPTIKAQLDRLKDLDMVVYSIGNTDSSTHLAAAGMATQDELTEAKRKSAVGILCCRYIDAQGQSCPSAPEDRLIAADLATLRTAKKRFLVVSGTDRASAAHAALEGKLATHLCVDTALGMELLG